VITEQTRALRPGLAGALTDGLHVELADADVTAPSVEEQLELALGDLAQARILLARLLSVTAAYAHEGETCVDTAIRLLDAGPIGALAGTPGCPRNAPVGEEDATSDDRS
jgi:hypothetical protein